MNKEKVNELYNQGYKPLVYIKPNKKYDKMILKTILQKENENLKEQLKALAGQFAIMKKTILDGGYWPPAAQSLTDLKIEEEE